MLIDHEKRYSAIKNCLSLTAKRLDKLKASENQSDVDSHKTMRAIRKQQLLVSYRIKRIFFFSCDNSKQRFWRKRLFKQQLPKSSMNVVEITLITRFLNVSSDFMSMKISSVINRILPNNRFCK